jgi:hypothetical protein
MNATAALNAAKRAYLDAQDRSDMEANGGKPLIIGGSANSVSVNR